MNTKVKILNREHSAASTAAAVTAAAVIPWLVHLTGAPGAVWLPLYTAPLLCGLFLPAPAVWLAALSGPLLSRMVSGMPLPQLTAALTVETAVLGGVLLLTRRRSGTRFFAAAAVIAARLSGIVPALLLPGLSLNSWFALLRISWPGMLLHVVLAAGAAVFFYRSGLPVDG